MTESPRDRVGTVEDLHASATKLTGGLTDFGTQDYLEGLEVLLDSFHNDEQLTQLGQKTARVSLRGSLAARLLSEAGWQQFPGHADVPVERPIFVTGLPRTGTTALHRLLEEDPNHQGLELWLTELPKPRPPRDTWDSDPVFAAMQAGFEQHHLEHPEFMGVHYIAADTVEECWQLLRQSMKSLSFESLAHLPTYSAWLAGQDWTDAYARHRRNLQLIGLNDVGKRWVLKNPSHLFALDALMAVYPDALVIQTHREPRTAIASACSLSAQATEGWSTKFVGETIGRDQLELWSRGLAKFRADRARFNPAQFIDVDYADFVANPMGTVDSIYAHFDIELPAATREAIADLNTELRSGHSRPAHQYGLADFGLTAEEVDERFADYLSSY